MSIYDTYKAKLLSAEQAVSLVRSGQWVDYGNFLCAPLTLDAALAKRASELEEVKVRAVGFPGLAAVALADPEVNHFIYNNWHFTGGDRILHDKGLCSYIPILYHEGPRYYERDISTDLFFVRCAPMDDKGFFNFGVANSVQRAQAKSARTIIVEVNSNIPVCHGGYHESLHISEVDFIVESDNAPLFALKDPFVSEEDKKIAEYIVSSIPNGACLQLGIGALPNAIGSMLADSDIKDLGVHTEMLVDSYLDMYEAGRITGRYKRDLPGKMTYTFALGSQRLYDFLHNNPLCASYPVDYVNAPSRIASNPRTVSINNAVEIDLYGQVSSESSGIRHISGTGGQFDFAFGAYHSEGGQSFICLRSVVEDKEGKLHSRIRPFFQPGSIVTLPRTVTNWVVTEFGMVNLKGKSTWERAEALVSIAHPDFREELIKEALAMNIWKRKSYPSVFPSKEENQDKVLQAV